MFGMWPVCEFSFINMPFSMGTEDYSFGCFYIVSREFLDALSSLPRGRRGFFQFCFIVSIVFIHCFSGQSIVLVDQLLRYEIKANDDGYIKLYKISRLLITFLFSQKNSIRATT